MTPLPLLDAPLPVFIGLTLIGMGFAAFMIGQAVAQTWRPAWQAVLYCLLLGLGDRFLGFALFANPLLSPTGYAIDTAALVAVALIAFRLRRAQKMVAQYPWLYRRAGLFGWQSISPRPKGPKEGGEDAPLTGAGKVG